MQSQTKSEIKTIITEPNQVQVLDQLLLPHQVVYITIKTCEDAWKTIRDMNVRGGPLIAIVALQGLRVDISNRQDLHSDINLLREFVREKVIYLKTSRPTAVNLTNDLNGLLEKIKEISDPKLYIETLSTHVSNNLSEYIDSCQKMANYGTDAILSKLHLKEKLNVLTICNTGSLGVPGLGTALGIVREIHGRGRLNRLYIPETRPYLQGSRLTSFEAQTDNIPATLITDSMAGFLMQKGKVDCVVVGADRVTKFGYTANKIGTYSLAVLAKQHNIPFYVACQESTIDMNMTYGRDIHIEERPADELRKCGGKLICPQDFPVWNPSFDVTPPSLIEAIVTEKGLFNYDRGSSAWEEFHFENPEKLLNFLLVNKLIKQNDSRITYIGDGNLNYVYCVRGDSEVICVKQALPWCKCIGSHFPLSLKRTLFETEALRFYNKLVPDLAPKLHYYNEDLSLFIMEFLDGHDVLRTGLVKGFTYKNVGRDSGLFVARTTFYSGSHHLSPETMRERMSFWNQNTLCKLTEQVVFSDPYVTAELNRWTSPQLDSINSEFKSDTQLILRAYELRQKFIMSKQALIHGDLHSGSIMVNNSGSVKIIDGEFSFYGPIGYDTGNFICHLIISYISHKAQQHETPEFYDWIINQIVEFWSQFEKEYLELWNNKELRYIDFPGLIEKSPHIFESIQRNFLNEVFSDTLGYAATEMIRRILGVAHVSDFESIQDKDIRAKAESITLKLARSFMVEGHKYKNIEQLVETVRKSI